jgi:Tfp pilus assembly PilM family ATPase
MPKIPVVSSIWDYLTAPKLPPVSLSISETHLSLIALRRRGKEFEPRNLGVQRLPQGLVRGSFTEPNIGDEAALIDLLKKTAQLAGLKRVREISVAFPAGSARSVVVTLDSLPGSNAEIDQMLEWKVERSFGQKAADLKIDHTRLADAGTKPQWIVSAIHQGVAAQYESVFRQLGWHAGLLAPHHLGEAQWLLRQGIPDDQIVLSLNEHGFDAVIVRDEEPILIREVACAPEEREDEFYRLMIFYRDRLSNGESSAGPGRMLTIGSTAEQRRFREVLSSAIERQVISLDPQQIGLRVDPNAPFNHFAAAGGLATLAWG